MASLDEVQEQFGVEEAASTQRLHMRRELDLRRQLHVAVHADVVANFRRIVDSVVYVHLQEDQKNIIQVHRKVSLSLTKWTQGTMN